MKLNLRKIAGWIAVFACSCSFAAERYYSPDKSVSFGWERRQGKNLLVASVRGVGVVSETGIQVGDRNYVFLNPKPVASRIDTAREMIVYSFRQKKSPVILDVALLNNAVAYRYRAEEMQGKVKGESSSFSVPADSRVYFFERKNAYKLRSYAGTWENCAAEDLPDISPAGPVQGSPLVFVLKDNRFAVATEVGLQNYSGLRWNCRTAGTITADFTEPDGFDLTGGLCSPWRVFFVAANPDELMNQTVVRQLAPAPDPELYADRSYIIPGKSVWHWFSIPEIPVEKLYDLVDDAHELGFRYSMIDEGYKEWDHYRTELKKLADYGKSKGVSHFLWVRSGDISDPANDYSAMRGWLDQVAETGIAGVKVDFMDSEAKVFVDFEIRLLKECAKRKLLVDFHGCHKPTGEAFTYPNEMTREGIRGLELNIHPEGPIPAYHNVLLPFTRLMLGHGDYTPLSFVYPAKTTFAHQLATLVAFISPLQVIAENPDVLLHEPSVVPALDFIRAVPVVWDESVALPQTEFGKTAVIARRSGRDWFVCLLNGTDEKRDVVVDIASFAPDYTDMEMSLYADDLFADKVKLSPEYYRPAPFRQEAVIPFYKQVKAASPVLKVTMAPCGGAVIWLKSVR